MYVVSAHSNFVFPWLAQMHGLADCLAALLINIAAVKSAAYQQYAGHNLSI